MRLIDADKLEKVILTEILFNLQINTFNGFKEKKLETKLDVLHNILSLINEMETIEVKGEKMEHQHMTVEEYINRFANQYCNGDVEQAKESSIAKEVCKDLKKGQKE